MASGYPSKNPASGSGNVVYYDEYSDPDNDPPRTANSGADNADDNADDDDDEEDDFIKRPRRGDSPPPVPYNPQDTSLKRKASDASRQPPPNATRASNGGSQEGPLAKRPRPEPLEPSILCAEPLDEFVLEIAEWVWRASQGKSNVEVSSRRLSSCRDNDADHVVCFGK